MRRFQHNNGLRVTGRVDKPTLQALNVPAQARLAQLRVNLQRLQRADGAADRGSLRPGQRRRLPARGGGAPPGGASAPRHRRQARAPDAGRARHHQGDQFLPLLARPRERRPSRPDPAARQGARVPRQGADPRLHRLLQRPGGRSHQHRLAPGGCHQAQVPPGPGPAERAGPPASRHAQRARRLHARHADEAAVQPARPRLQRRLRAGAGRLRAGRMGGALRAGLGAAGARAGGPGAPAGRWI